MLHSQNTPASRPSKVKMFPILSHYYSYPLPEMPPPDLLLLSLSTAAWIAALSAAIGLWRLKSIRSRPHVSSKPPPPPAVGPTELIPPMPAPSPAAAAPAPARPIETCHVEGGALGSPRSRFMMKYACDDADECHVEEEESGEYEVISTWEVTGPRWMGVRGDLGWYRYQDRTAIGGSVVRLWDFNGGLTAGPELDGWGREGNFCFMRLMV